MDGMYVLKKESRSRNQPHLCSAKFPLWEVDKHSGGLDAYAHNVLLGAERLFTRTASDLTYFLRMDLALSLQPPHRLTTLPIAKYKSSLLVYSSCARKHGTSQNSATSLRH